MADNYGPLVVSSWEIAKDCFTTNDRTLATRVSIVAGLHMGYNNAIFAFAPYGEYWRSIRKMVTVELLSSQRLEKLKHIRFSEMDYFIKDLYCLSRNGAESCAKVTISEALERFTFNISLKMLVRKRFSGCTYAEVNSEPWRYEKAIKEAIDLFGIFVLADALPYLEWVDIQGHILDRQVGTERWVEESDIKNLKYLQAIVKETLRLYPPGHITRIREATQDCHLAGYDVPKGTCLIVNLWKLHRDPRVWENADLFQPERFMTTESHLDVRGQNLESMPFSSSRRSCPAITFGLQVVHLTVAKLIQGFEIRTIDGMAVDMEEGLGFALPKLNPLEVVLSPRLRSELYEGLQDVNKY
ncbi:Cytochrome P450 82C4 [Hibiscus syriacus]|uniref:Cytochrome P450 82C4 n=1 Tax=Hibiscus syriacus TaxID=106335 RepID=A0A6A2XCZ1_HIBSY|nr:Cytochrome P450 82C4 [Hibiscus syriacus]